MTISYRTYLACWKWFCTLTA